MESSRSYNRFVIRLYWYSLLVLLLLTVLLPKTNAVLWINHSHTPFQDWFFKQITPLGGAWIFIPIFIYTLFLRYTLSFAIGFIAIIHGIICSFLKRVVFADALRPTALINNDLLYLIPDVGFHASYSFPSGHTATVFCIAVYLSLLIRHRLGSVFLLVIAFTVGYSRIYLLQHFLMDVTAGAFIGTVTALAIAYYFDRNNFPHWTNSSLKISRSRPNIL